MTYTLIPITIKDDLRVREVKRIARFAQSHPGMFDRFEYKAGLAWGVTIKTECLQIDTRETWTEFQTVWTLEAAREALGY